MIEISKELLEEVLNVEISEVTGMLTHKNNQSLLSYITKNCSINDGKELINIYELMNKMKLWAYDNDYEIMSGTMLDDNLMLTWYATVYPVTATRKTYSLRFDTEANNEFETVKECCEWILKEIKR